MYHYPGLVTTFPLLVRFVGLPKNRDGHRSLIVNCYRVHKSGLIVRVINKRTSDFEKIGNNEAKRHGCFISILWTLGGAYGHTPTASHCLSAQGSNFRIKDCNGVSVCFPLIYAHLLSVIPVLQC